MKFSAVFIFKISFLSVGFFSSNFLYAPKNEKEQLVFDFYEQKMTEITKELSSMNLWSDRVAQYLLLILTIRISMALSGGGFFSAISDAERLVTGRSDTFIKCDQSFFNGFNINHGPNQNSSEFNRLCLTVCLMSSQGESPNFKTTLLDEEFLDFFVIIARNLKASGDLEIGNFLDFRLIGSTFDHLKIQKMVHSAEKSQLAVNKTSSISSMHSSTDSIGHIEEKTPISSRTRSFRRRSSDFFGHFTPVLSSDSIAQEK